MRHLQNRKYQRAEQAPTRCPYGGFVSEEPSRRGWQGHVEQRSRAVYTAVGKADERRPDPSACEVGQTGAPEVAEPEQHECSGVTRFQDERIEYPWEAHRSERYRGDPRGCHPHGESREENVQHSCRLIGGKRTSKPDEQRDAMYNPRNVGLKPQECSLEPRVNVLMIQNSAHFNTVVIATVVSKDCDHTPLYRQAGCMKWSSLRAATATN